MTFVQKTLVLYMAVCIVNGYILTSNESFATEKAKTASSVFVFTYLGALLVFAMLERSAFIAVAAVVIRAIYPGTGQVIALIVMKQSNRIGMFSWIMVVLAFIIAYCLVFGRVVYLK